MTTDTKSVEKLVESIKPFNGENWPIWSFQLKMVLRGNGLWSTVEPGQPPDLPTTQGLLSWDEKTDRACAIIVLSCSTPIQTRLMNLEKIHTSPKDLYEHLRSEYAAESLNAHRRLRQEIDLVLRNKPPRTDLRERMKILEELYDQLREVGVTMTEAEQCEEVVRTFTDPALLESVRDLKSWKQLRFSSREWARTKQEDSVPTWQEMVMVWLMTIVFLIVLVWILVWILLWLL
ncbi:hypothetical protein A4X13_0g6426 [Tilletia indica]|uniref:Uncharacterized protein n=1 Tax=Tilletia indica TaxID=43049 RepID=A0A177TCK6_9BASI|nr:hypothetical protein A4X13_0g6426 [Tilletia indica]